MLRHKVALVSAASIVLGLSLAGCGTGSSGGGNQSGSSGASNQTSGSTTSYKVNIGTATTTGVFYPLGAQLAKYWSDDISGVRATSQTTNGSAQNLELMKQGQLNVAFTTVDVGVAAYNGTGSFKGNAYKDERVLASLYPSVAQLVVSKSINSVSDLKGKGFVPGAPGSSTQVVADEILAAYGMSESDVNAQTVGFTSAIDLMKNNQASGAFTQAGVPSSDVEQMLTTGNDKLLSLSQSAINELTSKYPYYYKYTIPAGKYDGQSAPVQTIAEGVLLVVPKSMPEKISYELTKELWQNIGAIGDSVSAAKGGTLQDATQGLDGIPLASGAKKYYTEQGVLK